jgi:PhnB protein
MSVTTTAHINFRGKAREALEFYESVFGGDATIATYADIHAVEEPAQAGDVAFGRVDAPSGFAIRPLWDALADSATAILVPLALAPFAPLYGMLTDRYGVTWIVGADTAPEGD